MAALRRIAARIRSEHSEVVDVRVFGSVARGDQTGASDVDVLLVLRSEGPVRVQDPFTQAQRFYPYFDLPIGVDLIVLGEEELARRRTAGEPFAQRISAESLSLNP